jgi:alpha-ribazole phosphatase
MNVYLMRHPAREGGKGVCIGQTDVGLSAEGRASLPRLCQKAADLKPSRVISSDLQRCRSLAEGIASLLNLTVEINPAWRELNFGDWESRTFDEIQSEDPLNLAAWMENYVEIAPSGGESFRQLQTRALGALNQLGHTPGETVLVATHAGVIRSLISAAAGLSLTRVFEIGVQYGGLTHLAGSDGKWTLVSPLELTDHSVQKDIR